MRRLRRKLIDALGGELYAREQAVGATMTLKDTVETFPHTGSCGRPGPTSMETSTVRARRRARRQAERALNHSGH